MDDNTPDTQSTIDRLLLELGDMLQMIQNHKGPINITPEIIEKLQRLNVAISWFNEVTDFSYKESNINLEKLKEELTAPDAVLSTKEKQFFKRAQLIEKDARNLQLAYSKAIERAKQQKNMGSAKGDDLKQKRKERRKLFKPLGGDKKWIPL